MAIKYGKIWWGEQWLGALKNIDYGNRLPRGASYARKGMVRDIVFSGLTAVEAQATDRAYRIGQHSNVQVHRFISKNTFEEKIDAMIQKKKALADMTVETGENWIGKLSNKELREIFW